MKRQCELQCHFFQLGNRLGFDSELARMTQVYCRGSMIEICRRREIYLSGGIPAKGMTPKGSYIASH